MNFQWKIDPRWISLACTLTGVAFFAIGLIPVVASDSLARSFLSFSCLLAGVAFLIVDCVRFPAFVDIRIFGALFRPDRRTQIAASLVGLVAAVSFVTSISTLTRFYTQRLRHDHLLSVGEKANAKILQLCGWRSHGCLTVDLGPAEETPRAPASSSNTIANTNAHASRIQKSIPIDANYYQDLNEGDVVSVVYPKGQISAAVFTEFNFDRWKPQVPRSWGFLLFTLLAVGWYPLKRRIVQHDWRSYR